MIEFKLQEQKKFESKYLIILSAFFSSTWLISNITAIKLINIWGVTLTGSFFIYPFSNVFNNIIIEIYGYKNARQVLWSGFVLNIIFVLSILLVHNLPASPSWKLQNEYNLILLTSTRITCASLLAFLISDFLANYFVAKLKLQKHNISLTSRIFLYSMFAITIDIFLFFSLAFLGTLPTDVFINVFFFAFIKKILCQILFFPIVWFLIDYFKNKEGFEIYDDYTKFTPFSLDNVYDISAYRKQSNSNHLTIC